MPRTRSRLVAALVTAVVAVAGLAGVATPASAAAVPTCSNAACPDPTGWATERWKPHAGYPSHGGTVDGANCTNYVAWRLIRTGGITETAIRGLGNAATWDTKAAAKGYTVNRTPALGAVAQWDANHVAYVEQVNVDGTIVISESNVWVGTSSNRMWLRHRVIQASAVDNFIHVRPPVFPAPRSVFAPGDFDGDGAADLMAVRPDGILTLYRGDGAGGFREPAGVKVGTGWAQFKSVFAVDDFSGDGFPDVMAIATDGKLFLYRGNGAGGWLSGRTQVGTGWAKMRFVFSPGDFTGDGEPDVLAVLADGKVKLYSGNGTGGWKGGSVVVGSGFAKATHVGSAGDFDGDGFADMIAVWPDGTARLYAGTGTGRFRSGAKPIIGTGWKSLKVAGRGDMTGDDLADLFALRGGTLVLHPGDGAVLGDPGDPLGVTW